jgi:hypothetical protein
MMRRQRVRELMVRVHRISPELAAYHVRAMTPSEVKQRFLMYMRPRLAGAELSVASPKSSAGNVVLPGPRPCDEKWQAARHSTLFPETAKSEKSGTGMPDSEVAKPGRKSDSERSAESEGYEKPETLATFGLV